MKRVREKMVLVTVMMLVCTVALAADKAEAPAKPELKPLPWLSSVPPEMARQITRIQQIALRPMNLKGTKRGPHYTEVTKKERKRLIKLYTTDPEGKGEFVRIRDRADRTLAGSADDLDALEWAWMVTREKKYFENWHDRLIAEINRANDSFPTAFDLARRIRNSFIWGKDTIPGYRLLGARRYDLMCGYLSRKVERQFRWQLKKYCDGLRTWTVDRTNHPGGGQGGNMAALTVGRTSPIWFAIGYDEVIDWAISHPPAPGRDPGGMLQIIRFMRDGHVWGEALVYQWYVGWGFEVLTQRAARYDGRDVWNMVSETGTKPRCLVDGMTAMAFPLERTGFGLGSVRIANFGEDATSLWRDQWLNYGQPGRLCWNAIVDAVYSSSKDKGYAWLANVHKGEEGMPPGAAPPPAPCSIFPSAGIAMLRADTSPGYWAGRGLAMQVMGGEPRRSAPGESFSIRLHGAGRLLYADWPMVTYELYEEGGWERAGIRRNSAMIDGRETWQHRTLWRHAFWPEVKYLSLRASRYGHDHSERAFMMTDEYLLDVFDMVVEDKLVPELSFYGDPSTKKQYAGWSGAGLWEGDGKMPRSHTFDYVLHGIGQQFPSNWWDFAPSREITAESWPNRWFANEKRCEIGGSGFYVDWMQRSGGMEGRRGIYHGLGKEWFEQRAGVRMHMLGSPGTVAYTLEAPMGMSGGVGDPLPRLTVVNPDEHPEMTLKSLIVRRRGKAAQFAALHEAYRDRPAVRSFEYLHKPKADDTHRTVGVRVTGPDYMDRLYLTLGLDGEFKDAPGGASALKTGKEEVANLTLNWLFMKDPDQVGEAQRWFDPVYDRTAWRKVNAGVNWQKFEKGYYGSAWYAKSLPPMNLPAGRKAYLLFEGVDEDVWVYLDGKKVYERVAKLLGDSWNKPFVVEVTDTFTSGKPHLLVVKVRKIKYQTGIYLPVRLMVEALDEGPRPDPEVTVTTGTDPNERITFRGEAYVRVSGEGLLARGNISGFCIHAPDAKKLTLNGKPAQMRRAGEYSLYGTAREPSAGQRPAREPDHSAVAPVGPAVPVEISFPQQYVNIDEAAGGVMVVRLTNRSQQTVSGTLTVKPGPRLKADEPKRSFAGLPPAHRVELAFELTAAGANAHTLVPLEAIVEVAGAERHKVSTRVAVGVVVEEVPATYVIPLYDYSPEMPGRPRPREQWRVKPFDYIQVRAPGYTIRIDKYSGLSRWIMDPTGLLRTSQGWFPFCLTRHKSPSAHYKGGSNIISAPGLDWFTGAKCLGPGKDAEGNPTLSFESADGEHTVTYVLKPSAVEGAKIVSKSIDVPGKARLDGVGFALPEEPWWQEKPVSIWPTYPLEPPVEKPLKREEQGKNLLAGTKPNLTLPKGIEPTMVYVDEKHAPGGSPSICFDLDKLPKDGDKGRRLTAVWPVIVKAGRRYRFVIAMRHENVDGITRGEWTYTYGPLGTWVAPQLARARFWPRPVRGWFAVYETVKAPGSSQNMRVRTRVPCVPGQTGKAWLAFRLEEAEQ